MRDRKWTVYLMGSWVRSLPKDSFGRLRCAALTPNWKTLFLLGVKLQNAPAPMSKKNCRV